jgi:hypothetical protein
VRWTTLITAWHGNMSPMARLSMSDAYHNRPNRVGASRDAAPFDKLGTHSFHSL